LVARDCVHSLRTLIGILKLLGSNSNGLRVAYIIGHFPLTVPAAKNSGVILEASVTTEATEVEGVVRQTVTMSDVQPHA